MRIQKPEDRPPPVSLLVREMLVFPSTRIRAAFAPAVSVDVDGAGRPVIVIPGFMASDRTTARLRRSLTDAGFVCRGWGMGRNLGIRSDIFERMDERLSEMETTAPVTLVGWSLGGLIAREYAKYAPHRVAKVITLGAPFSSGPRANNGWRIYEMIAGPKVADPPLNVSLSSKPAATTVAFWSSRDGMVAPCAACGLPDESDLQLEENCTHMGLIADPRIIRRVAEHILD